MFWIEELPVLLKQELVNRVYATLASSSDSKQILSAIAKSFIKNDNNYNFMRLL